MTLTTRKGGYTVAPTVLLTYLYFLQGLPYGLQARFLPIYFRSHGMSLSNIGFIKILFFPWMCKTLWAPFVDRHGNKKAWLFWSMLGLGVTCVIAAGIEPSWLFPLCVILLVFNFLTSTQDIATDGLAIEILTSSQVASGNTAQVVGYKFGAIIGGGLLAWLSDRISWSTVFIFLTLIYAVAVMVVMYCVPEENNCSNDLTMEISKPFDTKEHTLRSSSREHVNDSEADTLSGGKTGLRSAMQTADMKKCGETEYLDDVDMERQRKEKAVCQTSSSASCGVLNSGSAQKKESSDMRWILDHFAVVLNTEGTVWILAYVLVYKLGEQGALNMMPMFLIDHGVPTADVGLWTGVVGLAVSIAGSVIGGAAISSDRYTALGFLRLMTVVKVGVLTAETVVITTYSQDTGALGFGTRGLWVTLLQSVPCLILMLVLLFVSGAVSTAAFTLMMQSSQRASPSCRASHYSLLATAEVLGKLVFSVFVGAITDLVGYPLAFGLFLALSCLVLPMFRYVPPSLLGGDSEFAQSDCNKKS